MLGCQSIGNRQCPYSGRSARLGYHATMTQDRAGAVAATMEKHQNAGGSAARHDGIFSRHAAYIDCSELHVVSYWPNGTDIVEAPSSLRPADRTWLGTQQCADGFYFALSHCLLG